MTTLRGAWARLAATGALGAALLAAAIVVDVRLAGVRPINERDPAFAPVDRVRTAIVLTAALTFVGGVLLAGRADPPSPTADGR